MTDDTDMLILLQEIRDLLKAKEEVGEVMNIRGLSAYLKVGVSKLSAMVSMKQVPFSRFGKGKGSVRFQKGTIDQWLAERRITSVRDELRLNDGRRKHKLEAI